MPIFLSAKHFIGILEEGGEEMLRIVEGGILDCKFHLPRQSFQKIINSKPLRLNLLAHKDILNRVFRKEISNLVKTCRSPLQIYYGLMLTGEDSKEWGTEAIREADTLFIDNRISCIDQSTILFAIGRVFRDSENNPVDDDNGAEDAEDEERRRRWRR